MVNFANVSKVLERSMTRTCAIKLFWCLNTFVQLAGFYHPQLVYYVLVKAKSLPTAALILAKM
jgi:hypothetical protein